MTALCVYVAEGEKSLCRLILAMLMRWTEEESIFKKTTFTVYVVCAKKCEAKKIRRLR